MIGSISNKAVLHRPAATRIGGRGAQGMSMIEVLVSVMVLGVGLLAGASGNPSCQAGRRSRHGWLCQLSGRTDGGAAGMSVDHP